MQSDNLGLPALRSGYAHFAVLRGSSASRTPSAVLLSLSRRLRCARLAHSKITSFAKAKSRDKPQVCVSLSRRLRCARLARWRNLISADEVFSVIMFYGFQKKR